MIKNQLKSSGCVVQMPDQHAPKQIFFSKLLGGSHFDRGQKCNINDPCWKETARVIALLRTIIGEGTSLFEARTCQGLERQRHWKECQQQPHPVLLLGVSCPQCDQVFQARVRIVSHLLTHC